MSSRIERSKGEQSSSDSSQWKEFAGAKTPEEFARLWLSLQCRQVKGVQRAVVVLGDAESGYVPAAFWPQGQGGNLNLNAVAEMAMEQKKPVVRGASKDKKGDTSDDSTCHLAFPFVMDEELRGVVAMELSSRGEKELREVMRELQWGSSWLEVLLRRKNSRNKLTDKNRLGTVLGLIASALENESFKGASYAVVTEMAVQLGCERVSLGFVKRSNVRVNALSHSSRFNKKSNLIKDIGSAMNEALDQGTTIVFPALSEATPLVNRVHESLCAEHGDGAVCTVPMVSKGKIFGALTFEKSKGQILTSGDIDLFEAVAQMVGPILLAKRREDRSIFVKNILSVGKIFTVLFGARHWGWKLGVVTLASLIYFFSTAMQLYRVSADTRIEGAVQRVIVSPMDGYVVETPIRPGDIVKKGDLLFKLDDKDLLVERFKWNSQIDQLQRQYRDALAKSDRSEINILRAQLGQARAKLELTDKHLARTKVWSPFDGVIVSGDLSQSLGAPVSRGDVLFQLTPLRNYRVILEVDEKDIAEIQEGQTGELVLTGAVEETVPFAIRKITPVSETLDGGNFFRVEAQLTEPRDYLQPGMEGVGKIDIEERKLIWVLTHEMINWWRLTIWTWWP